VNTSSQVKGIAFRSVIRSLEKLRGESAVESALNAMPEELAQSLRYGKIVASGWYPIEWYRHMYAAILSTTGEGERLVYDLGRESAYMDITGVYKAVFKLLSPQVVFSLSARLFSNYYTVGTVTIVESRKGFVQTSWSGCTDFDRYFWVDILASTEVYLELAGAKNVRIRVVSGGGPGDDHMLTQAYWT
jgi:hypothetical protein